MSIREMDNYVRQVDAALATQRLDQWQLNYDTLSDTLYIDFDDIAGQCISSYLNGGWMLRLDVEFAQVHGLHIENVLSLEVKRFPFLLDLILLSRSVGFTPSPVEEAARVRVAANPFPTIHSLRAALPLLTKSAG